MQIQFSEGNLNVPANATIGYIDGEGIGPEITEAMIDVINSSLELAYSGERSIEWNRIIVGSSAFEKYGTYMPEESIEQIRKLAIVMKSTLNIIPDKSDLNMLLRRRLGLYANVRIIKHLPGIGMASNIFDKLNITIFRDSINTSHIFYHSTDSTDDLIKFLSENYDIKIAPDSGIFMVSQSKFRTKKLVRLAINYYKRSNSKKITVVDNPSSPEFAQWCREEIDRCDAVDHEYIGINSFLKRLANTPESFDIVILDNIIDKIIIDYMVSAINIEYGASIGDECALFEAVQNSMPSSEGYDTADPLSFILSGSLMLRYIGWNEAAEIIDNAIVQAFLNGQIPRGIAGRSDIKPVKCSEFSDALIKRMKA
ncbi:MAG: isocitrate/isopropylmalate family dehydrogenase [Ferroplasma sp.]